MHIPRIRSLLALALACVCLPALAAAQTVHGRVVEAGTGQPVAGAIVLLVDANGGHAAATLSDAAGAYRVTARGAGTYTLRVERVGYTATTSAPVTLAAGETVQRELMADVRRVVLDSVVATGSARRCAGELMNGAQAATLWDEARKAVHSSVLALEGGTYRFVTETREREVSLPAGRLLNESTELHTSIGLPFRTLSAEELVNGAYVVMTSGVVTMYGVDAQAILSDTFLRHHCFGMRGGGPERPGLVGLEFVPLEGRVQPDVHGVLWIDRASAELRYVEYGYTNLRFRGPVERLTGRLDFQRLPNGMWVTESWVLVVPMLQKEGNDWNQASMDRYRMYALLERSSRVVSIEHFVAEARLAEQVVP